jgi:hypothetical protein
MFTVVLGHVGITVKPMRLRIVILFISMLFRAAHSS